jgi:phage terminase small subunit
MSEPRRDRIVAEYAKDFNATQAAILAGYSRRAAGSKGQRLLSTPPIGEVVSKAQSRVLEASEVTQQSLLRAWSDIAFPDRRVLRQTRRAMTGDQMPPAARRHVFDVLKVEDLFENRTGKGGRSDGAKSAICRLRERA